MPRYQVWYGERTPMIIEAKDIDSLRRKLVRDCLHLTERNGIGFSVAVNYKRVGELLYGRFSGYEPFDRPLWRTANGKVYYILKDGTIYR